MSALPDPMRPRAFRVKRRVKENADTVTLELRPEPGEGGDGFLPGQFNMLWVAGAGEVPISISGDPTRPGTLVHTTRAVGAATRRVTALQPGDPIGVRGPFGTAWPVAHAAGLDLVLVAGGIGLAPLRPALMAALADRERYGRIALLYGARRPEELLFRTELRSWRAGFDLEVGITVDRATPEWRGNVGVVTSLIPRAGFDPHHAAAFVCGPEIMMRFAVRDLEKRGVPSERIWVSLERNMKCGVGLCGHCQMGPLFVCRDGPVFRWDQVRDLLARPEV